MVSSKSAFIKLSEAGGWRPAFSLTSSFYKPEIVAIIEKLLNSFV
jgi:hypothetical protein